MESFIEATRGYERWLRQEIDVVEADLRRKHRLMGADPLAFLRATFYRWVPLFHALCPDLAAAQHLLAVGDLHVENFGTWRDVEGRLVWGVNDFDEAAPMPYAIDLVRLATSAVLAAEAHSMAITPKAACNAILAGYSAQLASGGRAFVLEEDHPELRAWGLSAERDPDKYWAKMTALPAAAAPPKMRKLLAAHLPARGLKFRTAHRVAGLGSLGRPRYVALAQWEGALVAREAKPMLPSAYGWAMGKAGRRHYCRRIVEGAVRCKDPYFAFTNGWLVRRIAPRCSRIDLAMLPKQRDEAHLLEAMGRETANVHLGSRAAMRTLRADLAKRPKRWLHDAAKTMAEATVADWKAWKARG